MPADHNRLRLRALFADWLRWMSRLWVLIYLPVLALWLLLYILVGDRLLYMTLVNAAAVAYFLPLPFALPVVWKWRRWWLRAMWLVGALAFFVFWGPLFLPRAAPDIAPDATLRIMTYNAQIRDTGWERALTTIKAGDADIVLLQEVNFDLVAGIQQELGERYPYVVLDPRVDANGMAVLSTLPFDLAELGQPTLWNGHPIFVRLEWQGQSVQLLNLHAYASGLSAPDDFSRAIKARRANFEFLEEQIPLWLENGPLIVAGDFNITHLNEGYDQMTRHLRDAWWEAGRGFGFTYPVNHDPEDGYFVRRRGLYIPQRIIRIDYVFVSDAWQVGDAELVEYFGGGDHVALVVELALETH